MGRILAHGNWEAYYLKALSVREYKLGAFFWEVF